MCKRGCSYIRFAKTNPSHDASPNGNYIVSKLSTQPVHEQMPLSNDVLLLKTYVVIKAMSSEFAEADFAYLIRQIRLIFLNLIGNNKFDLRK